MFRNIQSCFLAILLACILINPDVSAKITSVTTEESEQTFAVFSDVGQFQPHLGYLMSSLKRSNIKDIVMAGDNVYEHGLGHQIVWNTWRENFNFFGVAIGNHHQGYQQAINFFKLPGEYYTRIRKDIRIIVLNSDNMNNVDQQAVFLEHVLKNAVEKFVFVTFHHSPVTISRKHDWKEREQFANKILPILLRYKQKITAVFVGHDHQSSLYQVNGLLFILAASAYQNRESYYSNYVDNDRGINVKTLWNYLSGRMWLKVTTNSKNGSVLFSFIEIDKKIVECSFSLPPGQHPRKVIINQDCWE